MRRLTVLLLAGAATAVAAASCGPHQPETAPAPERAPAGVPVTAAVPAPVVDSGPGGPPAPPAPPDTVVSTQDIRIGLVVGAAEVSLGGGDALVLTDPAGTPLMDVVEGTAWRVRASGAGMTLTGAAGLDGGRVDAVVATPRYPGQFVRVDGRDYRGEVTVLPGPSGLTVVNRLGIESYLAGVLSAEMGRRDPLEAQAVYAQAVVSRTYAVRNQGKRRALGFDLYGSVADQVYGGVGLETPMSWDAVRATRALIVTWQGRPIDAFFFSTCGGRTESGVAVFQLAGDPYLAVGVRRRSRRAGVLPLFPALPLARGVHRRQPRGDAAADPAGADAGESHRRHRHPRRAGVDPHALGAGGRRPAYSWPARAVTVSGQNVRRIFLLANGEMLRSTSFDIQERADGARVSWLAIDGAGAGHGVGFCQWGAVGRAREGQGYEQILAAYYPSTRLERLQ